MLKGSSQFLFIPSLYVAEISLRMSQFLLLGFRNHTGGSEQWVTSPYVCMSQDPG